MIDDLELKRKTIYPLLNTKAGDILQCTYCGKYYEKILENYISSVDLLQCCSYNCYELSTCGGKNY